MTNVKEALKDIPFEELERIVEEKRKEQKEAANAKRIAYENDKNELVLDLCLFAETISTEMLIFKQDAFNRLRNFYAAMKSYGDVKDTNKGNFRLKSADGNFKVEYSRQIYSGFDERADMAEQKLRDFLAETVKKRDMPIYELVMGLLERNKVSNDFDPKNIQKLYAMEDKFEHPLWKESIQLFKESFNAQGTNYYARFFKKDSTGAWKLIDLNFSSLKVQ